MIATYEAFFLEHFVKCNILISEECAVMIILTMNVFMDDKSFGQIFEVRLNHWCDGRIKKTLNAMLSGWVV